MQMTKELLVVICAQLLLLTGVHSVPLGTFEGQSEDGDPGNFRRCQSLSRCYTPDDRDSQNNENVEEPLPTEAYLKEIREQVEDEEDPLVRDTRSTSSGMCSTKLTIFNCIVTVCLLTA